MKRIIAVLALAGLAVGGAGVAWAQTSEGGDRAERRAALRTCVEQAKQDHPDADRATLKPAVQSCMEAKGFPPGLRGPNGAERLTPEQKEQAKACLDQARQENPDAGRRAVRAAARPCLEEAGLVRPLTPEQQARRAKLLACLEDAKEAHPGDRPAIRQAVKECMGGE